MTAETGSLGGLGLTRRLRRILGDGQEPSLIVPIDDSFIVGPIGGLLDLSSRVIDASHGGADSILVGLGGCRAAAGAPADLGIIVNLFHSTARVTHTRKIHGCDVEVALASGADAVAVHLNTHSRYLGQAIRDLRKVRRQSERLGIPLFVIAYPRGEHADGTDDNLEGIQASDPAAFARAVSHAARLAVELGADIVKTKFVAQEEGFRSVVSAACGVPVVIAGGALRGFTSVLTDAENAVMWGARGISFGRNIFHRVDVAGAVQALRDVMARRRSPLDVGEIDSRQVPAAR